MLKRDFLKLMTLACAGMGGGTAAMAQTQAAHHPWPLWASRAGEQFRFDAASPDGYRIAQYLLRDVRANRVGRPHPQLLRLMAQTQHWWALSGHHVRIDITSGLRTQRTNNSIEGAAKNSLHLPDANGVFFAADFRAGRVAPEVAASWLRAAGAGGIGIYPQRGFLHADVGRVRTWRARS